MRSNRNRWQHIRLTSEEYDMIKARFEKSTCQKMSEYSRSILLRKVTTVKYRNESLDEMFEELVTLRKGLNAVGNNLNQAVHKLNTLDVVDHKLLTVLKEVIFEKLTPSIQKIQCRIAYFSEIWTEAVSRDQKVYKQ